MNHPLRWLSLVPLSHVELPRFQALAAWHAEHDDGAPPLVLSASTDNLLALTIGDDTAAITLVPRPIPWSQLEGPAATAWYWPSAAAELRDHAAHLLVTLVDEGGQAINKSILLTRITAAVAANSASRGVFWGPGRLVHPADAFIRQATQMSKHNLPLYLWVDFRIEQLDDGLRLYTTGLEALGGAELEAQHFCGQPQRLMEYAYNVAHYQLDRKKVINDGDAISLSDDVQVTARRGPSMVGGDMEVIRLEFQAP